MEQKAQPTPISQEREGSLSCEISGDVPNAKTIAAIKEAQQMEADPSLGKTYSSAEEMMADILPDPTTKHQERENSLSCELSGDEPNAETLEAIAEVQRMKADPTLGKTYTSVKEMMADILSDTSEDDDEE